jgi:hypothetical protein
MAYDKPAAPDGVILQEQNQRLAQATFKDLAKTFEVVMEQLEHAHGVSGVQLAYVPRKKVIR